MGKSKIERLSLFNELKTALNNYKSSDIEDGIMRYYLNAYNCQIDDYSSNYAIEISNVLNDYELPTDLITVIDFFETLLEENTKNENGIVFTPKYISDYIVKHTIGNVTKWSSDLSIIDPSCGCGVFLVSAAEYLHCRFNVPIDDIIKNNIYGIELNGDNSKRCELVIRLLSAKYNGDYRTVTTNIKNADSLKEAWTDLFGVESFNYIIGNPPYVNPHDMAPETAKYLKAAFTTTQKGVYNIFYAFIEHAMKYLSQNGLLGYIVPNNFLTIKSAFDLREYIKRTKSLKFIVDFGDNMVFKPVRTYNCIIVLSKNECGRFEYYVMPKVDNIESALYKATFDNMQVDSLDSNGWKLVDKIVRKNISRIESQSVQIKQFIRTGIATLKDSAYIVEHDGKSFFKTIDGKKYFVEAELIKPIYKIPELKSCNNVDDAKRYIIFPYKKSKQGYVLIPENELIANYPKTYDCLASQKDVLESRDNGKGIPQGWYAYGRTQGLNKYGRKLLFPTFSNTPRFTYVDNEDALFCNGYAVFENEIYDMDVLSIVLNSSIMDYYVRNTSYAIEGGYYCYQKKYVEKFAIPDFTDDELTFIRTATSREVDNFLWKKYNLE